MGMFYRTIRMIDNGIKPVYVFDGKPPTMKSGEVRLLFLYFLFRGASHYTNPFHQLALRLSRRKEAKEKMEEAEETGTAEDVDKFSRRTVKVTQEHNDECKKLLKLMGIPYVEVSGKGGRVGEGRV